MRKGHVQALLKDELQMANRHIKSAQGNEILYHSIEKQQMLMTMSGNRCYTPLL